VQAKSSTQESPKAVVNANTGRAIGLVVRLLRSAHPAWGQEDLDFFLGRNTCFRVRSFLVTEKPGRKEGYSCGRRSGAETAPQKTRVLTGVCPRVLEQEKRPDVAELRSLGGRMPRNPVEISPGRDSSRQGRMGDVKHTQGGGGAGGTKFSGSSAGRGVRTRNRRKKHI